VIVLDAGALVALDRNDRAMWADITSAGLARVTVVVPTAALAQVWRGSPQQARLARALHGCDIASFDDLSKASGELCGTARTSDVVDASVALTASRGRATHIYTSDVGDIKHLLSTLRALHVKVVRC
jgi:hypothetical protein